MFSPRPTPIPVRDYRDSLPTGSTGPRRLLPPGDHPSLSCRSSSCLSASEPAASAFDCRLTVRESAQADRHRFAPDHPGPSQSPSSAAHRRRPNPESSVQAATDYRRGPLRLGQFRNPRRLPALQPRIMIIGASRDRLPSILSTVTPRPRPAKAQASTGCCQPSPST